MELFRIITMLLIVAHHYVVNSGLLAPIYQDPLSGKSLFLLVFGAWGKTGINCFLLITGYFMCTSKISLKKFLKLYFTILFYKIVFYFIFMSFGYETFTIKGCLNMLLPFTSIAANFFGCYLMFYLTIPFLNILVRNMNEREHSCLLVLCSIIFILLGTVPLGTVVFNYVTWFAVIYFFGAYIRLYPKKIFSNVRFWAISTCILVILSIVSVVICTWYGTLIGKNISFYFVSDSNKILAVLTALSAFLFFKNLNLGYSKLINTIAASAFGVLAIHANSNAMRQWLWKDTLQNATMYTSEYIVLHAIGSVIVVYLICTVIDYFRIKFIEIPFFKLWDKRLAK